jgi:hypothetical protein
VIALVAVVILRRRALEADAHARRTPDADDDEHEGAG